MIKNEDQDVHSLRAGGIPYGIYDILYLLNNVGNLLQLEQDTAYELCLIKMTI